MPSVAPGAYRGHPLDGAAARSLAHNRTPAEAIADATCKPRPRTARPSGLATRRAADVKRQPVRWLWPGRFPRGKLVVLDGDPGTGKSLLMTECAARVSRGKPWPDGARCVKGTVLYFSAEDDPADTIAPRLAAAGADLDQVIIAGELQATGSLPSLPGDVGAIEQEIRSTGARLVVFDVLMAYLGRGVDSHRDQDVRDALTRLARVAARTGACIVVIRHLNKAAGLSAMYRGGGSIGITGQARAAYVIAKSRNDPGLRVLACTKINIAEHPRAIAFRVETDDASGCPCIAWAGESDLTADDLLSEPGGQNALRSAAEDWLTGYMEDNHGEAKAADVLRDGTAEGFSKNMLHNARIQLGISSTKDGFRARYVWRDPRFRSLPQRPEDPST